MAGIYLHIPFCRRACHYCNFHFSTNLSRITELTDAMVLELELQRSYLEGKPISTIYFGGGTPSLLTEAEFASLFEKIRSIHEVDANAEITIEVNPEDVGSDVLRMWQRMGINRLSLGVQGFQDAILYNWNRVHNSADSIRALDLIRTAGFDNISVDLIYGDPQLTDEAWIHNMKRITDRQIPHVSCYALTVEQGTALAHMVRKGSVQAADDAHSERHFNLLHDHFTARGYDHYEVSNLGKPGYHSRHNTSYWQSEPYLGIGPAAHSFNTWSRQWNIPNNVRYIECIHTGIIPAETEHLTPSMRFNEIVMTGLRTMQGVSTETLRSVDPEFVPLFLSNSKDLLQQGKLEQHGTDRFRIPYTFWFMADGIAAELFAD